MRLGAAVQRQSPMPLHHQIKVALLHGIEEGWLEPGRQLPRERELAEFLGVSLAPVRQAMADLNKEGYLDRSRGRGTFVRARKVWPAVGRVDNPYGDRNLMCSCPPIAEYA